MEVVFQTRLEALKQMLEFFSTSRFDNETDSFLDCVSKSIGFFRFNFFLSLLILVLFYRRIRHFCVVCLVERKMNVPFVTTRRI